MEITCCRLRKIIQYVGISHNLLKSLWKINFIYYFLKIKIFFLCYMINNTREILVVNCNI